MSNISKYKPKKKSLEKHEVPSWFHDAKLGIFIHWGLYSVPAYATNLGKSIKEVVKEEGIEGQLKNSQYAKWYCNAIRIDVPLDFIPVLFRKSYYFFIFLNSPDFMSLQGFKYGLFVRFAKSSSFVHHSW
ncbi:MAG: alpha-L-fucosidase [Candidatus Hodarchaeota archaeon]